MVDVWVGSILETLLAVTSWKQRCSWMSQCYQHWHSLVTFNAQKCSDVQNRLFSFVVVHVIGVCSRGGGGCSLCHGCQPLIHQFSFYSGSSSGSALKFLISPLLSPSIWLHITAVLSYQPTQTPSCDMTEHVGVSMVTVTKRDRWNDFDAASLFRRSESHFNHLPLSIFKQLYLYLLFFFYLVVALKWNKNKIVQSTAASIARAAWLLLTVGSHVACCITHTHTLTCSSLEALRWWLGVTPMMRLHWLFSVQCSEKFFCSWTTILLFSFLCLFYGLCLFEILSLCSTLHSCACFTCEHCVTKLYIAWGCVTPVPCSQLHLASLCLIPAHSTYEAVVPSLLFWFIHEVKFTQCCSVAKLKHETFTGIIRQGTLKRHQPNKDKSVCLSFTFFLQMFASWYGIFCMLWHKSLLDEINISLSDIEL
jgi:hypothetical protein